MIAVAQLFGIKSPPARRETTIMFVECALFGSLANNEFQPNQVVVAYGTAYVPDFAIYSSPDFGKQNRR